MKKSVTKKFKYLKYRKEDILNISEYIFNIYKKAESDHRNFFIKIECENSETLEIENDSLRNNSSLLDIKKILHIIINYHDYKNDRGIRINIVEGNDYYDHGNNDLFIEARDKEWVDSKLSGIEEIYSSVAPQNTIYKKYRKILFHYLSLTLGYSTLEFIFTLLNKLGYKNVNASNNFDNNPFFYILHKLVEASPLFGYIILGLLYWLFGMSLVNLFWHKIDRYLENIWPSIEFVFGPEHKQYSNKLRKAWVIIIAWVALPVLLQILLR